MERVEIGVETLFLSDEESAAIQTKCKIRQHQFRNANISSAPTPPAPEVAAAARAIENVFGDDKRNKDKPNDDDARPKLSYEMELPPTPTNADAFSSSCMPRTVIMAKGWTPVVAAAPVPIFPNATFVKSKDKKRKSLEKMKKSMQVTSLASPVPEQPKCAGKDVKKKKAHSPNHVASYAEWKEQENLKKKLNLPAVWKRVEADGGVDLLADDDIKTLKPVQFPPKPQAAREREEEPERESAIELPKSLDARSKLVYAAEKCRKKLNARVGSPGRSKSEHSVVIPPIAGLTTPRTSPRQTDSTKSVTAHEDASPCPSFSTKSSRKSTPKNEPEEPQVGDPSKIKAVLNPDDLIPPSAKPHDDLTLEVPESPLSNITGTFTQDLSCRVDPLNIVEKKDKYFVAGGYCQTKNEKAVVKQPYATGTDDEKLGKPKAKSPSTKSTDKYSTPEGSKSSKSKRKLKKKKSKSSIKNPPKSQTQCYGQTNREIIQQYENLKRYRGANKLFTDIEAIAIIALLFGIIFALCFRIWMHEF